nr:hypothetical protein [uncultured Anaeromusa sp.]
MNALVVGYGSIGSRHARLLRELGVRVGVVSSRADVWDPCWDTLETALFEWNPEYIILANRTSEHWEALQELAKLEFKGIVLCEKPFYPHVKLEFQHDFKCLNIAYNLRFHPVLSRLRELIEKQPILSVQAYVGQYLPNWRPNTDYRQAYSSYINQGGGVLRDLSHELDFLQWIFGSWKKLVSVGGHISSLEIETEDAYAVMWETEHCPIIVLQMNYLDRITQRVITVNTDKHTYIADFIKGSIYWDEGEEYFSIEIDDTYKAMHNNAINGINKCLCSQKEGEDVVAMIEAIEISARERRWVKKV